MTCWCWDLVLLKFPWFSNDKIIPLFFRDREIQATWNSLKKPIRAPKNPTFDPSSFKHFAPRPNPPMCRSIIYRAAAQLPIFGMKQQFCKTWNFEIPKSLVGLKWVQWVQSYQGGWKKFPKIDCPKSWFDLWSIYPWHKVKKKRYLGFKWYLWPISSLVGFIHSTVYMSL